MEVGQAVKADDVIALVETDKVTVDIKAQVDGVITQRFGEVYVKWCCMCIYIFALKVTHESSLEIEMIRSRLEKIFTKSIRKVKQLYRNQHRVHRKVTQRICQRRKSKLGKVRLQNRRRMRVLQFLQLTGVLRFISWARMVGRHSNLERKLLNQNLHYRQSPMESSLWTGP